MVVIDLLKENDLLFYKFVDIMINMKFQMQNICKYIMKFYFDILVIS